MVVRTYDEFLEHGPGAILWSRDEDGEEVLVICIPHPVTGAEDARNIRIYLRRTDKNWAAKGKVMGWDGNREAPTLSPSVDVPDYWHGFIVKGQLCADPHGNHVQWR